MQAGRTVMQPVKNSSCRGGGGAGKGWASAKQHGVSQCHKQSGGSRAEQTDMRPPQPLQSGAENGPLPWPPLSPVAASPCRSPLAQHSLPLATPARWRPHSPGAAAAGPQSCRRPHMLCAGCPGACSAAARSRPAAAGWPAAALGRWLPGWAPSQLPCRASERQHSGSSPGLEMEHDPSAAVAALQLPELPAGQHAPALP
jgi:hypothetical protein